MIKMIKFAPSICILLLASQNIWAAASAFEDLVSLNDSTKCMKCHEEITPIWQASHHAHSFANLDVLSSIKKELSTPGVIKNEVFKFCVSCHAPQIKYASDKTIDNIITLIANASDQKGNNNFEAAIKKFGSMRIDCRVCHMLKGMPEGETLPKIIYGPGWDEHEHSHMEDYGFDTIKSEYLESIEFCTNCHRKISSDRLSRVHSLTHKKETMEKSKAAGSTCNDCHMSSGHSFNTQAE